MANEYAGRKARTTGKAPAYQGATHMMRLAKPPPNYVLMGSNNGGAFRQHRVSDVVLRTFTCLSTSFRSSAREIVLAALIATIEHSQFFKDSPGIFLRRKLATLHKRHSARRRGRAGFMPLWND